MDHTVWVNGEYVLRDQATISIKDRGLRLGDVVFDTSRTFNGKVYRLRDHLKRLYRSLAYTRIDPGINIDEMEKITLEVVERNESVREPGDDYMVTQFVTRGQGRQAYQASNPVVSIWIDPIGFPVYGPQFDSGSHVVIPKIRSYSPDQLDPKIKHWSRLNFVLADLEATDVDPEAFAVLLDTQGNLTECSDGANFFIVTDGVLKTPTDYAVLPGISRDVIFELAKQLDIPAVKEDIQPYHAYTADEAFLASTPYCILPVSKVDNRTISGDVPGPITKQLLAAWSEQVGVDIVGQAIARAKA